MIVFQGISGIRCVIVASGYIDIYLNRDTDYVPTGKGKVVTNGFIRYDIGENTSVLIHSWI